MAIFGQYSGGDAFNVAGNMDAVLKQQQATHQSMLDAVAKFNSARDEMDTLRKTTGAILSQYGVDDKGKPADSAPKYVHDLYNSINKEGGLSNISRSQMVAGIQAYQTGVGIEQQQLQIEGARNANRHNAIANDMAQMQLDAAKRQLEEQARIREAKKATQADIEKLSKTKDVTTEEVTMLRRADGLMVDIKTSDLQPLLEKFNTAKTDQERQDIKREVEKLVYKNTPESSRYMSKEKLDEEGNFNGEYETVENPDYKPFVSSYDPLPREIPFDRKTKKPTKDISPSVESNRLESFFNSELAKYNQFKKQTEEKAKLDVDIAKYESGSGTLYGDVVYNDDKSQSLHLKRKTIESTIASLQNTVENKEYSYQVPNTMGTAGGMGGIGMGSRTITVKLSEKELLNKRKELIDLKSKRDEIVSEFEKRQQFLKEKASKATGEVTPYQTGRLQTETSRWDQVTEKVVTQVQKDLYEQTDDEYAILSNWMKANGGVPETFTKEAFYASKGISRPIVMDIGGGQMYAKIGGKEAFLENKAVSANALSITDQKALFQAKELATARDLSGFQTNGFKFSGQIRVGDIDQANRVKLELGTSTRALANVDRLIKIAEDSSLYDKLMPAEISGIAQALTNAAQSANRTEIGGSGAWSNQDQEYMNKIIRDPTSGFNALFTKQTIASLKEYRSRLAAGLADKGAVYGFRYEQTGGGLSDKGVQQMRVAYAQLMASGNYTPQEALQLARQHIDANYE